MKTDFKTLKDLHEYYAVNNNCGLKETATQPVYEITPPSSGILFIGEAPGKHEDLQGRPFVGSAGKFLDELLQSIGYTREEVYVSNIVKYRPPSNRDPQDDEKNACRVWLNAELVFVKPKVIVTLGRHALGRFVPGASITASHGQSFEHPTGIPIFAMYHPAAALYNPNLKEDMKKDFKALKKFLSTLPKKKINILEKQEVIDEILKL
ncbi:uracil-DNA glycosylase [Candidatus Dojkabacteria bacterium]|nr:uracil-DNA glycosylase [Candidatus Dojkabacteria bacterium]